LLAPTGSPCGCCPRPEGDLPVEIPHIFGPHGDTARTSGVIERRPAPS